MKDVGSSKMVAVPISGSDMTPLIDKISLTGRVDLRIGITQLKLTSREKADKMARLLYRLKGLSVDDLIPLTTGYTNHKGVRSVNLIVLTELLELAKSTILIWTHESVTAIFGSFKVEIDCEDYLNVLEENDMISFIRR